MKNIFQSILQWQRGNATAKVLNRLDDHMLADIGIARGDINKSVHIFHWRHQPRSGVASQSNGGPSGPPFLLGPIPGVGPSLMTSDP